MYFFKLYTTSGIVKNKKISEIYKLNGFCIIYDTSLDNIINC